MRSSVSKKNKFYISSHRYYELKHRCLQYGEWKKQINDLVVSKDFSGDPTGNKAAEIDYLVDRIEQVNRTCEETDSILRDYILWYVSYGKTYNYLRTVKNMPCSRDIFYEIIREFYWRLDKIVL